METKRFSQNKTYRQDRIASLKAELSTLEAEENEELLKETDQLKGKFIKYIRPSHDSIMYLFVKEIGFTAIVGTAFYIDTQNGACSFTEHDETLAKEQLDNVVILTKEEALKELMSATQDRVEKFIELVAR